MFSFLSGLSGVLETPKPGPKRPNVPSWEVYVECVRNSALFERCCVEGRVSVLFFGSYDVKDPCLGTPEKILGAQKINRCVEPHNVAGIIFSFLRLSQKL